MEKMPFAVQRVIFKADTCAEEELFYRRSGEVKNCNETGILIKKGSRISLDTYFNLLDVGFWKKYAGITQWEIVFWAKGTGQVQCINGDFCMATDIRTQSDEDVHICVVPTDFEHYLFLRFEAEENLEISQITFYPRNQEHTRKIELAVIICTYKRNKEVLRNLKVLQSSDFFKVGNVLFEKMNIHVVDNASELKLRKKDNIHLYHNPNTGGSGGFSRGMDECCKTEEQYRTSHVLLMDDDVEFMPETLYRLYALLQYLKPDYQEMPVAGRMFRTDIRHVQYTAAEIWNKGNLQHIGFMQDMTRREALMHVNDNKNAEYGGWWFCCYPMGFVRKNRPLPFFLHCDDVEYGLRCGKAPIILNGVQVWHETYEYRVSPVVTYYDYRNSLIVNQLYGLGQSPKEILLKWKKDITKLHNQKEYKKEYMTTLAYRDYLKGMDWLKRHNNKPQKDIALKEEKIRWFNAIVWRVTYLRGKFKL